MAEHTCRMSKIINGEALVMMIAFLPITVAS